MPWHAAAAAGTHAPPQAHAGGPALKFDFGPGKVRRGYTQVLATTLYTKELGYGFEPGAAVECFDRGGDELRGDLCASDKPFFFSIALAEGNYNVTVTFGDRAVRTSSTIRRRSSALTVVAVSAARSPKVTVTL